MAIDANGPVFFACGASGTTMTANFGASAWAGTPSAGFAGLCTAHLPEPSVVDPRAYFETLLYIGDGTSIGSGGLSVTGLADGAGVSWTPDFVWTKNVDQVDSHMLFDVVRGATDFIESDSADAAATDAESLDNFDAGGFTVCDNAAVNTSTEQYVAHCFKAGGAASSNADGSITSSVSVADHGGFSVVAWTGTGSNATIGHGLSRVPQAIFVKRTSNGATSWKVYTAFTGETDFLKLDTKEATADLDTIWNDTAPTSSAFSVGTHGDVNDAGYQWMLMDSAMNLYNGTALEFIYPDQTNAGDTQSLDFTANGFKCRQDHTLTNNSGDSYIYLAIASAPFGGADIAQARAR